MGAEPRLAPSVVRQKAKAIISETWQSQANLALFLVLLVLIVFVLPVLGVGQQDLRHYGDIGFNLLLVSGVAIAWGHNALFLFSGAVASVAIAVRVMGWITPTQTLLLWTDVWTMAAVLVISFVLLSEVFRKGPVTWYRIMGAIAVYLLFGIAYAHAYHLVSVLRADSFSSTGGPLNSPSDWAYYSFVTLSTVGYGDITAVRPIARVLSVGEALTGQLYLAVLIARLVAMQVISWQTSNSGGE